MKKIHFYLLILIKLFILFQFVSSCQKEVVINAHKIKLEENPGMTFGNMRSTLSKQLGTGEKTISNSIVKHRLHETVSSPNNTNVFKTVETKIDDCDKYAIRRKAYQFWCNRQLPTLDEMLTVINEDDTLPSFTRSSFNHLLKSMEIECCKRGRNSALLEKIEIVQWRRKYLRDIMKYRNEGRPIYYLGETRVNAGDVSERVWCDEIVQLPRDVHTRDHSTGPVNPPGEGKCLIVVHIGSEDGFVPGGLLCFESKRNGKDFHDEINGDFFHYWLNSVLPGLEENALIIMDNAPCHCVKLDECPTINWRKTDIMQWLESKGEVIDPSMITPELLGIVERLKPTYSKYVVDQIVRLHNKEVLRLPPNHCELNPIELAWSVVKDHVKSNNKTFKLPDMIKSLIEGTEKVDARTWKNLISHIIKEEKMFWNMDSVVDELMTETQTAVMTINNSDEGVLYDHIDEIDLNQLR